MSKSDKGVQDSASAAAPIVLVIGRLGQYYLTNNEVLRSIYGDEAPVRVAIPSDEADDTVAWEMFYLYGENAERKLKLLDRFDHVPVSNLDSFLAGGTFLAKLYEYTLEQAGLTEGDAQRVRVIICKPGMLRPGLPMSRLVGFFPNATLFTAESSVTHPMLFDPAGAEPTS